jgi:membrane fusion protein (multidrug efflux system)
MIRTSLRTRALAGAALAIVLVLSGCTKGGPKGGGFSMPPMPAETSVVLRERVFDRFEAVGSIEAGEAITVVSEIDAAVVSLPFHEGQPVARGTVLARLDDSQLKAEVDRAAATRDQAKSTYDRVKEVVDQKAGSMQDLDDAGAALKVADANLGLARTRLSKTRIVAPFSGVVGSKKVSPGAYLRVGTTITDLAQIAELKVIFSAPERYLGTLKRGSEVTVSTPAFPNTVLTGRIDVVDPVLDPGTRSAQVIARVRNPRGEFRPGMSANVSAVLSERMNALTIPNEAVFAEGNQTFVYVVGKDSTVARTPIQLGTRLAEVVEVVSGLEPGARIVVAGHQKLFDKARVIPIDSHPDQGASPESAPPGGGAPGAAAAPAKPDAGPKGDAQSKPAASGTAGK